MNHDPTIDTDTATRLIAEGLSTRPAAIDTVVTYTKGRHLFSRGTAHCYAAVSNVPGLDRGMIWLEYDNELRTPEVIPATEFRTRHPELERRTTDRRTS